MFFVVEKVRFTNTQKKVSSNQDFYLNGAKPPGEL